MRFDGSGRRPGSRADLLSVPEHEHEHEYEHEIGRS
jgi:hypothetical protein